MRILLAIDGSACGDAAAAEVARRPWPDGSEVCAISVIEPTIPILGEGYALPQSYYDESEQIARARAQAAASSAVQQLKAVKSQRLTIDARVLRGLPKDVILDEAEKWEADLIVLGSHGHRGLTRFLWGSVSQAVAAHAKCSVEIVRRREATRATKSRKQ